MYAFDWYTYYILYVTCVTYDKAGECSSRVSKINAIDTLVHILVGLLSSSMTGWTSVGYL